VRIVLAVLVLLLAACSGTTSPEPLPSSPDTPVTKRTQTFEAVFELEDQQIRAVGEQGEKTYGTARYGAELEFMGQTFDAEMTVATDYVRGNGTFEGFVTLDSPDGTIGLRITGVTSAGDQGEGSAFSGETEVIGGSGDYDTLAGRGQFAGQRTGPPGSPVNVQVSLEVIDPK
jgi:hypothetical protein